MEIFVDKINNNINNCIDCEASKADLRNHLTANLASLHHAVNVNSLSPVESLMEFSFEYIACVPEHLSAFEALAEEAKIKEYVQPFLSLIVTYFINPPETLNQFEGLHRTLHQAYLCHRTLEELNDKILGIVNAPLAPLDMSMANIICHNIIGEENAAALDHLVMMSVELSDVDLSLFDQNTVQEFFKQRQLHGWQSVLERWPCFTKDMSVLLEIGQ